jgi:hypothetical protein
MTGTHRIIAFTLLASIGCFSGGSEARAAASDTSSQTPGDVVKNIGDVLVYIVPATAFGMTLGAKDWEGSKEFLESGAIAMGVVASFKYTVKSRRPDGNPQSFPSGHTAIMVQQYSLPAYALAGFVGYSRIASKQHYPRDVIAGAAFGFFGSYLVTKPYKWGSVQVVADGWAVPRVRYTLRF